jgi:hypothetical protein
MPSVTRTAAILVALALPAVAMAQPNSGDHAPDRLPVGTVHVGSIVEASFVVYEAGNTIKGVKLEVEPPPFVKVIDKKTYTQEFGPGNDFVGGLVTIAIDTGKAGEFAGDIKVTLGAQRVKVPVSVTVKPQAPGLTRVLSVGSPFNSFSTDNANDYRAWTDLVKGAPLDVSYLITTGGKPVFRDLDLPKFNVVLLGAEGLANATADDVKKVRAFAEDGGRVVVGASAYAVGSVGLVNRLLDGYGLAVKDEEADDMAKSRVTLGPADFAQEVVKEKIASLHFFRASPIAVLDAKKARVVVNAVGVGQPGDGFVAVAKAGRGRFVVLGDAMWWYWIGGEQARRSDNANLLKYLLLHPQGV